MGTTDTQGAEVFRIREVRKRMYVVHEGTPARSVLAQIIKYVGNEKEPTWMDVEQGTYNFPFRGMITVHGTHSTEDFETLCHVVADISAAPCKLTRGESGKMYYSREYEVVLVMGPTELKAQIRWIDSETVRIHELPR